MSTPAVAVPAEKEWPKVNAQADEYRRVLVTGTYRHQNEAAVYTTLSSAKGKLSGQGYWILTPLTQQDGSTVIINRGFVPLDRRDPATRKDAQTTGQVTVTGLLRMPEPANWFTPANVPAKNNWYRKDPAEIAATFKLSRVAPFLIDADASANPGNIPQGGETLVNFPNNHLGYALTWFGLAAALLGVFLAFSWQRLRER